ncbi:MAG: hypothetical protein KAR11_01995 [Phycisphaerae bacterium]|nr:hypothetical protein [Phycisphaerae bacterium]
MKRFIFGMLAMVALAGFCLSAGCEKNEMEVQRTEERTEVISQEPIVTP